MIRLVVALPAEARPLVSHLGMQREPTPGRFETYRRDDLLLVVSGIGPTSSAAAATQLFAFTGEARDALWLNLGIAGHATRDLGDAVLAHKVVDAGRGRAWYPQWVLDPPCATGEVRTVERVEKTYPGDAFYEMEAAGFFAAASRFATAELVQALKVVSDNRERGTAGISARRVEELIEGSLEVVDRLLDGGRALARSLAARAAVPAGYRELLDGRHFTVTQRRRLRRLLARLEATTGGRENASRGLAKGGVGKRGIASEPGAGRVLERLQARLEARRPGWS